MNTSNNNTLAAAQKRVRDRLSCCLARIAKELDLSNQAMADHVFKKTGVDKRVVLGLLNAQQNTPVKLPMPETVIRIFQAVGLTLVLKSEPLAESPTQGAISIYLADTDDMTRRLCSHLTKLRKHRGIEIKPARAEFGESNPTFATLNAAHERLGYRLVLTYRKSVDRKAG